MQFHATQLYGLSANVAHPSSFRKTVHFKITRSYYPTTFEVSFTQPAAACPGSVSTHFITTTRINHRGYTALPTT